MIGTESSELPSGDVLAREQVTAAGKEQVLDAVGQAATKLRGELGESLARCRNLMFRLRRPQRVRWKR